MSQPSAGLGLYTVFLGGMGGAFGAAAAADGGTGRGEGACPRARETCIAPTALIPGASPLRVNEKGGGVTSVPCIRCVRGDRQAAAITNSNTTVDDAPSPVTTVVTVRVFLPAHWSGWSNGGGATVFLMCCLYLFLLAPFNSLYVDAMMGW